MFNTTCTNTNRCTENHRKKTHNNCDTAVCTETATWGPLDTKDRIYCQRCKTQKIIAGEDIEDYTNNASKCMDPDCDIVGKNKIKYGARGTSTATVCKDCAKKYNFVVIGATICEHKDPNNEYDCITKATKIVSDQNYCATHAKLIGEPIDNILKCIIDNCNERRSVQQYCSKHVSDNIADYKRTSGMCIDCGDQRASFKRGESDKTEYCGECVNKIKIDNPDETFTSSAKMCEIEGCSTRPSYTTDITLPATRCLNCCDNDLKWISVNTHLTIREQQELDLHRLEDKRPEKKKNVSDYCPRCSDELNQSAKVYGWSTDGKKMFCKEHMEPGMVNVISNRCTFDLGPDLEEEKSETVSDSNGGIPEPRLCGNIAQFGLNGFANRCPEHVEERMNLLVNNCKYDGCNNRYTYGTRNLITGKCKLIYCETHKDDDMIANSHPLCKYKEDNLYICNKRASFPEVKNGKETYCETHNINKLPNIIHKQCNETNCIKRARYGSLKGTRHIYKPKDAEKCFDHKTQGMINMIELRCVKCFFGHQHQDKNIRRNQEFMCYSCYRESRDPEALTNVLRKEHIICNSIKEHELIKNNSNVNTIWDKAVGGGSRRRPDILIKLDTHNIIVEIDEKQHNRAFYTDEDARILEIYYALESIPLVVIRFNPDSYYNETGKQIAGLFQGTGIDLKIRTHDSKTKYPNAINDLVTEILDAITNVPTDPIKTVYLRYNLN